MLAGCATSDYQPYEGRNNVHEGVGGTKHIVKGVEVWANGTPPRKFAILGVVTSEIGAGYGDEAIIRSSVANQVKKVGGDAAVQINDNTSFRGLFGLGHGIYGAVNAKKMSFAIVKYLD